MVNQFIKITFLSFLLVFSAFKGKEKTFLVKETTTYVYICTTKNSYAYHFNYECRGMKQCKGEKQKVTLTDAKNKYDRKLCGWEK